MAHPVMDSGEAVGVPALLGPGDWDRWTGRPPSELTYPELRSLWLALSADAERRWCDAIPLLSTIPEASDLASIGVPGDAVSLMSSVGVTTVGELVTAPVCAAGLATRATTRNLATLLRSLLCAARERANPRAFGPPAEKTGRAASFDAVLDDVLRTSGGELLLARLGATPAPTYRELGERSNVSRQRAEQLVRKAHEQLISRLDGTYAPQVERLRERVGSAVPVDYFWSCAEVREVVPTTATNGPAARRILVAHLLGALCEFGWVYWSRASRDLHRSTTRGDAYVIGRVDDVREEAIVAGVRSDVIDAWMQSKPGVREYGGFVIRWPVGNVRARVRAMLDVHGAPQPLDELLHKACEGPATRGQRNSVQAILTRVSKTEWALPEWGLPPYEGIANEIAAELLLSASGAMPLAALVTTITAKHGVSEASVRSYALNAPMFSYRDGIVSLRSADNPFRPSATPERESDVFRGDSAGSFIWVLLVDPDATRGSGRTFPAGLAWELGLRPGGKLTVSSSLGDLKLSWLETSAVGPTIGSLTEILSALGAATGDLIAVAFGEEPVTVRRVQPAAFGTDQKALVHALLGPTRAREPVVALFARRAWMSSETEVRSLGDDLLANHADSAVRQLWANLRGETNNNGSNSTD